MKELVEVIAKALVDADGQHGAVTKGNKRRSWRFGLLILIWER